MVVLTTLWPSVSIAGFPVPSGWKWRLKINVLIGCYKPHSRSSQLLNQIAIDGQAAPPTLYHPTAPK